MDAQNASFHQPPASVCRFFLGVSVAFSRADGCFQRQECVQGAGIIPLITGVGFVEIGRPPASGWHCISLGDEHPSNSRASAAAQATKAFQEQLVVESEAWRFVASPGTRKHGLVSNPA
ncbi:hypothetical protein HIM_05087 [Hirsutella minnesotensis 3608]|uniref:Uncharacterized protein n=1 Tax=Hirsutella minnesotensis 3608 TaxID=1043627 RepID=A0A0F8A5N2_9HYPO|nr:hypothetical protein HIM_05087 [Hirsutella minnesotensis 3608]